MSDSNNFAPDATNGPQLPPWIRREGWYYVYQGETPFEELPFPDPTGSDEDARWALSDDEVCSRYQGLIVAVHNKKVWGAAAGIDLALADALRQPGCPPENELALVWIVG